MSGALGGGGRGVRRAYARAGAAALFVGVLVASLALVGPPVAAWSNSPADPTSWSNGVVLCQFAPNSPGVAVSRATLSGTGLSISSLGVVEASPSGSLVASADLGSAAWTVGNWSTDDAYDEAYQVVAPILAANDSSTPVGSVDLTVQFILPAYAGSPDGPTDIVSLVFSVDNWTWQRAGDHLDLSLAAAPVFPTEEHLNVTSEPGWLLASTSNCSGAVLEQLGANATASVMTGTAPARTIAAASLTVATSSSAVIQIGFADSAGSYSSLEYSARVAVVLPSSVAGIPLIEIAEVGLAGVLVSILVAVVTRQVRRRPSKLIYVAKEGGT